VVDRDLGKVTLRGAKGRSVSMKYQAAGLMMIPRTWRSDQEAP
jgi:hypothetical protein